MVPAEQLSNGWLKVDVLLTEGAAEERWQVLGVAPALEPVHMVVSDFVPLMSKASLI